MPANKPSSATDADDTRKVKHPLQAIVLADSFTRTFRPISLEHPKVLLPLGNVPMIEYTLEMLANAKVQEIIVVCCWHSSQVADYLRKSRWSASRSPVVRIESFPHANSAGDALRDLAITGRVQSDPFILISGDVVSNLRLAPILRAHEARPDKSKVVMTMVLRRCEQGHQLRNLDDDLVVVLDKETRQILMYEMDGGEDDGEGELAVIVGDSHMFKEHSRGVEIRRDYLDCYIDICSPEVLNLLQGEFHADLRRDFVRKEVANRELDRIFYAHEVVSPSDYAARVHGLRSYDRVSKDVIGRWLYPLVPDNNWSRADGTCWFSRGFMYRESGVLVDRTARVGKNTMLGADSQVGEGAVLESSVLGRRCVVGKGAVITNSYLWDGAVVKPGARVDRALLCNDCVVGENAVISRGCVVSFNVRVEPNTTLLPFTRLTVADPYENVENRSWGGSSEEGGLVEEQAPPFAVLERPTWKDESKEEEEERSYVAGQPRAYTLEEEEVVVPEEQAPEWVLRALAKAEGVWKDSPLLVMTSMGTDELDVARRERAWVPSQTEPGGAMDQDTFEANIVAYVRRVLDRGPDVDENFSNSVAMELRSLRASREDCSFTDLVSHVVGVLLLEAKTKDDVQQRLDDIAPVLLHFNPFRAESHDVQVVVGLLDMVELVCLLGPQAALGVYPRLVTGVDLGKALDEADVVVTDKLRGFLPHGVLKLANLGLINREALQEWMDKRLEASSKGQADRDVFWKDKAFVDKIKLVMKKRFEESEEEEDD